MFYERDGMLAGYALCDVAESQVNLEDALKGLGKSDVVELQPERFIWDMEKARPYLNNMKFISVHAPSGGLDLASKDSKLRYETVLETIKTMDIAHDIGAKDLVLHPVNNMYNDPKERLEQKAIFMQSFRDLLDYYEKQGHAYKICVENLEYPKYPATLEETLMLQDEVSKIHDGGMVIDIPHIWNTRKILREDPKRYIDWTNGYPNDEEKLGDYVRKFLERNEDKIVLYHIAGFHDGDKVVTHGPIRTDDMNTEYYELRDQLRKKPMVMEIHDTPLDDMKSSREIIGYVMRR